MTAVRQGQESARINTKKGCPTCPAATAANILTQHEGVTTEYPEIFYARFPASEHWPLKHPSRKGVVPCEGELTSRKRIKP